MKARFCFFIMLFLLLFHPMFPETVLSVLMSSDRAFGRENADAVLSVVTAHVADTGAYRVITAAEREKAVNELEFSQSDLADPQSQLRVGKLLSAARILSIRCSRAGDYLVVQLSMVDVQSGAISGNALGKYRNLGTLLESARALTAQCLGTGMDEREDGRVRFITVTNATELLRELRSNTVVTLAPGVYNLSRRNDVTHANLSWNDNADGFFPVVKSVTNLTLRSEGDASIVIDPAYGWLFDFQTCRDLRFERLRLAHTTPGFCSGGVLSFSICENIEITGCDLEGSGTYGLVLDRTFNLTMNGGGIRRCTYGAVQLNNSRDVLFIDAAIEENREYSIIGIQKTANVDFIQCVIASNTGSELLWTDSSSYSLNFTRCRFTRNRTKDDVRRNAQARFTDCIFE